MTPDTTPRAHANETAPNETIVAIATPPGRGGIGIVRLSGPQAVAIATPLLKLQALLEPTRARFSELLDPETGTKLDEAVVTWFAAPRSYTGEDVVEIAAHGSPVILDLLVRHALSAGARLAEPGEFTERAFLSGRIDLTQAEAVRDLIDAQTLYQARVAAQQLDGALSRRVQPIKQELIALIALLEAGIDFAEDDTPVIGVNELVISTVTISNQLAELERSFAHGRLVHAGLTLAIVGEPNVGKSSLFNRLVERERAIVTAIPGTTRDLVTERISLGGIPIELVDTAGMRQAADEAERIGIQKSREALAEADLVLLVLDAPTYLAHLSSKAAPSAPAEFLSANPHVLITDATFPPAETAFLSTLTSERTLIALNKSDLLPPAIAAQTSTTPETLLGNDPNLLSHHPSLFSRYPNLAQAEVILTSAQTGNGIATLREAMQRRTQSPTAGTEGGMLTNLRHHQTITDALTSLQAATTAATTTIPHEMLLLDLYSTLRHLDALTGETTPDDILNLIFSTFCIGK